MCLSGMLPGMNLSVSASDSRGSQAVYCHRGQRAWAQRQIAVARRRLWPARRMMNHLLVLALLVALVSLRSLAQTHSDFPVDIVAGPGPQPVMTDGRLRLLGNRGLDKIESRYLYPDCTAKMWRAQGDDFRTFISDFVSNLTHLEPSIVLSFH
jgi:hypothetical protein